MYSLTFIHFCEVLLFKRRRHIISVRVKIWRGRTCASAWSACSKARALPAAAHCSRRKISLIRCERFSRAWFHTARRAEAAQKRHVCRAGAARAHCAFTRRVSTSAKVHAATEHNGGFGFQTKAKDRFLNQRRWTCWYSCRENMQVLSVTDSLVLLFVFVLKSLLSLRFTSRYTMRRSFIFNIIIIWFLSVC